VPSHLKLLLHDEGNAQWHQVRRWLSQEVSIARSQVTTDMLQLILNLKDQPGLDLNRLCQQLETLFPTVHWASLGQALEIYKHVGSVAALGDKYELARFVGSHGIGHTRMATESVVNTDHCHPFTASPDLAIVHNGQISNYYKLRYQLEQMGAVFRTHNDSEVIAHYIHYHRQSGQPLEAVLHQLLQDIDGTYTILIATADQLALVRDQYAAKPAVIYESKAMVVIVSEYRAFLTLPDFDPTATVREPDAVEVNVWSVSPEMNQQHSASSPLLTSLHR